MDHELGSLLDLDGFRYHAADGHQIRIAVRKVEASAGRPHGVKYSLTLHDPSGRRIYGMDNAHRAGKRPAFDHRHIYGRRKIVAYEYRGPSQLLEDFYREVGRVLMERGISWP